MRVKMLHDALETSNRKLRETVEARARHLEEATQELQRLLEEKAHCMEGDVVVLSDIFAPKEQGTEDGRVVGELRPTGIRPKVSSRLKAAGFDLPPSIYTADPPPA